MKHASNTRLKADSGGPDSRVVRVVLGVVLVLAAVAAYANSFDGVFVLDDGRYVAENPRIRTLDLTGKLLAGRRPVVDVTLAFNYAAGELRVWGYHAVNLAIHVLAGLTLFGVIRRTLALTQHKSNSARPHEQVDHASRTIEREQWGVLTAFVIALVISSAYKITRPRICLAARPMV